MAKSIISHSRLLELLHYAPETGIFTWRVSRGRVAANSIAGHVVEAGYSKIRILGVAYRAHRLAWFYIYSVWPIKEIDHENHNRADNRLRNLRCASRSTNMQNASVQKRSVSGLPGVRKHPAYDRWQASITVDSKFIYGGFFADFFEACCARKRLEAKHGFHVNHGKGLSLYLS